MTTTKSLPTLLRDLLEAGREGSVVVADGESKKTIYFSPTGIRFLSSGKRRGVRIGEVLLKTGKISPRQLELVLEKQQKSNLRFGELLYLMCMITEDDIKQAVRTQIEEEIYDLFTWDGAVVEFHEGPPPQELTDPEAPITNLTFHVSTLLEEALRRISEWKKWSHKLPPIDQSLAKAPPNPGRSELPLDDRAIQVMELCDGRRGLEQVVESSPMFRFDTLRTIALLVSTGKIQGGGRVMSVGMPTPEALPSSLVAAAAGPSAGAPPAPGELRAPTTPTGGPGVPREVTRFGLDAVPDVDWKTPNPGGSADDFARKSTAHPRAADANGPAPPPPGAIKERTAKMMAKAAQDRPALLPPPLPPPRPARAGWIVAVLLVLVAGAAVGYEIAARSSFRDVDRQAKEHHERGDDAAAAQLYEAFARKWSLAGVASTALHASESLGRASADRDRAGTDLRQFSLDRLAALETLPIERQEALCAEALAWATEKRQAEVVAACTAWRDRVRKYRAGAAAMLLERRSALDQRRFKDAQELTRKARDTFGLDPEVRALLFPVSVTTLPPGADIHLNGILLGVRTPAVLEVAPEVPMSLRVEREGFAPVERSFPAPPTEALDLLLYALPKWSAKIAGSASRPAALGDGQVFAVGDDGGVTALSMSDGRVLWRARAGSQPIVTAPVASRSHLLFGEQDGDLIAMDVSDGSVLWKVSAGSGFRGGISLCQDGKCVFAGMDDDSIAAFETATGKALGRVALPSKLAWGPFTLGDGWVALESDGTVIAGDTTRAEWTVKLAAAASTEASAWPAENSLMCVLADGSMACVGADGTVRWATAKLETPILGVASDSGRVVVTLRGRHVRAFDLASGSIDWDISMDSAASAPPIALAGRVVIPCEDGLARILEVVHGEAQGAARTGKTRVRGGIGRDGIVIVTETGEVRLVR